MNSGATQRNFWQRNYGWFLGLLILAVAWALGGNLVKDLWWGWGYEASAEAASVREQLDLTGKGKRIFAASRVVVEGSEEFNQHCDSHDEDVSLLGCYVKGKIYIYNITDTQLKTANIVTAAHELLHAAWERMGMIEQEQVKEWLGQVYAENQEWFDTELECYEDVDQLEEIYTRAGTKLADLPTELEEHYAEYFRDRGRIVQFYQEYEAPFLLLKLEMEELVDEIDTIRREIETERAAYTTDFQALEAKIDDFNQCAATAGCFVSQSEFERQRNTILLERTELEAARERLNQKITDNNRRIDEYRQRQQALGELNAAMNSNIEPVEMIEAVYNNSKE